MRHYTASKEVSHGGRKKLNRRLFPLGVITLALSLLVGCSTVGPSSLSRGRVAYNEVLTETNAEQCLASIVEARYGQISSMLAVSSINANLRFRAFGGVNVGVGNAAGYAGNLVPLSGGAYYEENPTITYLPVQGEEHIKGLLAPVSLDVLISLVNSSAFDPSLAFILLVTRINRIPNRAFVPVSRPTQDERFGRVAALVKELHLADALEFVQLSEKEKAFALWIHDYAPFYTENVSQLLNILAIKGVATNGEDIFLPFSYGRLPQPRSLWIQTRSIIGLSKVFAATVDVPEEDLAKGLTFEYPPLGQIGELIRIRRSEERPENAVAATRHRKWWYYIDGSDTKSKVSFGIYQVLLSAQLAETAKGDRAAPLLTVPVGN
jgi:hypothetical protein